MVSERSWFSSSWSHQALTHFLARRLPQTIHRDRVLTSCCNNEWPLKAMKRKSYFVTGVTGFLGKVLIEKLLRASPQIGKIFLLMKSKDQESANKRLYDEIISSDLFKLLKQMHGTSYEAFMKSKLIPIIGDIGEENLGMHSETADKISEEIDVIINCAGHTTFDDRYDAPKYQCSWT